MVVEIDVQAAARLKEKLPLRWPDFSFCAFACRIGAGFAGGGQDSDEEMRGAWRKRGQRSRFGKYYDYCV